MIDFLKLAGRFAGLCFALYGAAELPLRAIEYFVTSRAAGVRPAPGRYALAHFASNFINAIITPAVCYVLVGLLFRAGGFQQQSEFTGGTLYWLALWAAGLLIPLQSAYYVNGKLFGRADLSVRPQWLIVYWGLNSCAAATLMWLPVWLGWIAI